MTNYIIRRLLGMIPMLFFITAFTFLLMHAAPGSAIDAVIDPRIKDRTALIARLNETNGFNKPLYEQYGIWLMNFLHGQWGFSFSMHEPVTEAVFPALGNTLYLALIAEVFILLLGIPLGIHQSRNPYGKFDNTATVFSVTLFSVPFYIVAIVMIYFLAIKLNLFPAQNAVGSGPNAGAFIDHVYHALLPALAIALTNSAIYSRYTRGSMLDVARKDFARTAYAKGLKEAVVFRKHIFRNGMIPIVTQFGYDIGGLVGGAVILEGLFAYQGMGYLSIQAAEQRDYNVILATTIIFAVGVLLGNLIADIMYAVVDPRIRYN